MKTVLKKSVDWYNPLFIDGYEFKEIKIVDGENELFSFNWFSRGKDSSGSIQDAIYFHGTTLVRSKLSKNKLRFQGTTSDGYILFIDKSILDYELVRTETREYDMNDTKVETYRVGDLEAYFTNRTQLPPNEKQAAYAALYDLAEENINLNLYTIKKSLKFYNDNKELFKKAGM